MRFLNVPARFSFLLRALATSAVVLLASGIPVAHAQNVSATASVTDTNVEPGQPVEYHIQIEGGQPNRPPLAPTVDGLTITYVGESRSMQFNSTGSGTTFSSTYTYNYAIDTDRAGRYVIPGQEIDLGKAVVRTSPVALNVTGNSNGATGTRNADQGMFLELVVPKKTVYVGESIPVEVRAYFGVRVKFQADPNPILDGDGFSVQKFTQPQLETQAVEGVQYNVIKYKTSIAAVKTGELSLGPISMEPVVRVPRPQARGQRRFNTPFDEDPAFTDPFGVFGNGFITKQVKMQSDPIKIEVKPLPPGAPEDFSGAIGQFKLEAEAQGNPRKAQAGEPITLHALLHGQGNFDRIQPPVLTDENGLQTYPATSKFKAEDEVNLRGLKTFEQVVIPRNGRNALPGYRFAYLDPSTGKYNTIETPPVPVKVQGSMATPTPSPDQAAVATAAATNTPAAKPTPTPKPEDILYIRNDPGQWLNGESFLPLYRRENFWLAQLAPLALLLGFGGLAWRNARVHNEARKRAADLHRQQSELVRTLQGEKTGRRDFYSAATRLAQLKVANDVGRASGSVTAREVCRAKGLDPATAASVEEIFHRHDELAYSGGRAALEAVPVHERRDVLETVGKL